MYYCISRHHFALTSYQAHQALSNWRNGFGAAALAVVTTFFANDEDCNDADNCILFAASMLHKSCFLFDNNKGDNPKVSHRKYTFFHTS